MNECVCVAGGCASDVATKRILLFINNDLGQTIGLVGARCPTH